MGGLGTGWSTEVRVITKNQESTLLSGRPGGVRFDDPCSPSSPLDSGIFGEVGDGYPPERMDIRSVVEVLCPT